MRIRWYMWLMLKGIKVLMLQGIVENSDSCSVLNPNRPLLIELHLTLFLSIYLSVTYCLPSYHLHFSAILESFSSFPFPFLNLAFNEFSKWVWGKWNYISKASNRNDSICFGIKPYVITGENLSTIELFYSEEFFFLVERMVQLVADCIESGNPHENVKSTPTDWHFRWKNWGLY